MKVFELITELLKYPAGYDIEIEVIEQDYTVDKIKSKEGPKFSSYCATLETICSHTTDQTVTLGGSFIS